MIDGVSTNSAHAKRADYLLGKIAGWCRGSTSEEHVANMTVVARDKLLQDYGIDLGVLDVLEGVNRSIIGVESNVYRCEEVYSAYIVLRGQ